MRVVAPEMVLVEHPGGGVAQLAVSPTVAAKRQAVDAWATAFAARHQHTPPPPAPTLSCTPPSSQRPVEPMLRRQNASRFSWPPDPHQVFAYISLSPQDLSDRAASLLGLSLTIQQVSSLILRKAEDSRFPAYSAYVARWRMQLEEAQ
ncbi:hypothetical protein AB1Y20_003990 [Prymnesium parvum]|uniref:Uncharacterized protein n=1 Tax=Prymnesium parvum TaxID=97485 RepID=A0AB34J853_PRYPA